jgi:hypothetical protein
MKKQIYKFENGTEFKAPKKKEKTYFFENGKKFIEKKKS